MSIALVLLVVLVVSGALIAFGRAMKGRSMTPPQEGDASNAEERRAEPRAGS